MTRAFALVRQWFGTENGGTYEDGKMMTNSEPTAEQGKQPTDRTRTAASKDGDDAANDFAEDNALADDQAGHDTEQAGQEAADAKGDDDAKQVEDGDDVTLTAKEYHELSEERDEYKDKFIRKVAELDNVIRRTAKEKSDLAKFGIEGFVKELLPVLDSFDQALPDAEGDKPAAGEGDKDFAAGMILVKKKLLDVFAKNGVEVVDDKGKPFDPNRHQAIQKIEDASVEVETISEQYQKGYLLNGRLVRPAMVVVAVPAAATPGTPPKAATPGTQPEDDA